MRPGRAVIVRAHRPRARPALRGLLALVAVLAPAATARPLAAPADWNDRLEALHPDRPLAYFELAEEIADAATDAEDRALARRLFALAGVLDTEALGRSAALALADLEEDGLERRRLLALATLIGGPRQGLGETLAAEGEPGAEPGLGAAHALAEAFSHYRRGQGPQALTALRQPGATELLESCDHLLPGGAHRFVEDCRLYRGQLRPNLSERGLERMLRLERALLSGADRAWSGDLLLRRGAPLIEVDPDQIAATLGVDDERPVYRDGRWLKRDEVVPR